LIRELFILFNILKLFIGKFLLKFLFSHLDK
jgi:hypothetical protein